MNGTCDQCPLGHARNPERTTCTPCPRYHVVTPDGERCIRCPTGSVPSNVSGATSCVSCDLEGAPEMDNAMYVSTDWEACSQAMVQCGPGWEPSETQTQCTACAAGQYWEGRTEDSISTCIDCPAGRADLDIDSRTGCAVCDAGTYTGVGTTTCTECEAGQIDDDMDASTPCSPCAAGRVWMARSGNATSTCSDCAAGQADLDSDSRTACVQCPVLTYAAAGSSACILCSATNQYDDDRDPSTPCTDTNTCRQVCEAGYQDEDCFEATPCTACAAGEYSAGGSSTCSACAQGSADDDNDASTPCVACLAGYAAEEGHAGPCTACLAGQYAEPSADACANCTAGSSDEDSDAATPCVSCTVGLAAAEGHAGECRSCLSGQYAAASAPECSNCTAGTTDHDLQPSTPCTTCLPGLYAAGGHAGECDSCPAGRFNPSSGGESLDACEHCSNPGSFSSAGSSACSFCSSGTADEDSDPSTACVPCPSGTFAGCGETQCNECEAGQVDSDSSPATPCTECLVGQYWERPSVYAATGLPVIGDAPACDAGGHPGGAGYMQSCEAEPGCIYSNGECVPMAIVVSDYGVCIQCPAGQADLDSNSRTRCTDCNVGDYAALGSTVCTSCHSLGSFDDDRDPATPCSDTDICRQTCATGFQDDDCSETTECVACSPGQYAQGGVFPESRCLPCAAGTTDDDINASTPCVPCGAGFYAEVAKVGECIGCPAGRFGPGRAATSLAACESCQTGQYAQVGSAVCEFCSAGRADEDLNASTSCTDCLAGTYAGCGETECSLCVPGQVDSDETSATPCTACAPGQYWLNGIGTNISTCAQCPMGRIDGDKDSTTQCEDCNVGEYCAAGSSVAVVCADIGQTDDDADPSTPCRADIGVALQANVMLDIDIGSIAPGTAARSTFEREFVNDMSALLAVQPNRIQIKGVAGGSVVVQFAIAPEANGASLPVTTLQGAFRNGTVELAGASAGELGSIRTARFECSQVCEAGFHDLDCDNSTACTPCGLGEFSAGGMSPAGLCTLCAPGLTDEDMDGSTSCVLCPIGRYTPRVGQSGECISCPAGRYTAVAGGSTVVVCDVCSIGQFSDSGSASCEFCSSGRADEDLNSSTPCSECGRGTYAGCGETRCNVCVAGQIDSDSNPATPCIACLEGQYWEAGTALNISTCTQCPPGRADTDLDSTTDCLDCDPGSYAAAGATACTQCADLGLIDHDLEAATPCVELGSQCTQFCEPGFGDHDCDGMTPCQQCEPGRFSGQASTGDCIACPIGRYEAAVASTFCNNTCLATEGLQCATEGMASPHPARGFFMSSPTDLGSLAACIPPEACAGGSYGVSACNAGYGGERCSRCLDRSEVLEGMDMNGYFREDSYCVPCGTVVPFAVFAVLFIIVFVAVALLADTLLSRVADVSALMAPFLVLVTFFQTLGLLLKFSLDWPKELKELLRYITIFNVNLDLAKPECSVKWNADTKMDVMLVTPFGVVMLIGSYGLSKYFMHHKDPLTNSHDLMVKCEAMGVGIFFVGTSFMLKGLLGGFDCSRDLKNNRLYLDIDPGIECYTEAHTSILIKGTVGLLMWGAVMGKIAFNFLREGGKYRYSFLTTKLEDKWFWWELLLLARKTAIMVCGLFNTSNTARGWYCGSMVIIGALAAHAYARPYKDSLVDFTELASLMSTLIIFQSGMVWNSSIDKTGLLSWFLERLSIVLVIAVAFLGVIAQADALMHNAHDSVHFSAKFVRQRSHASLKRACAQLDIDLDFLQPPDKKRDKTTEIPEEVKMLSEQMSKLDMVGMVNSCCTFWAFEFAEELLLKVRQLPERQLADLLFLERAKGRKMNRGVQRELERQLMAVHILKCRPVVKLAENIIPARRRALSLAYQLNTPAEFEEAIMVLERKKDEVANIRHTLWRKMSNRKGLTRDQKEQEWIDENPMYSEWTNENRLHGVDHKDLNGSSLDDTQDDGTPVCAHVLDGTERNISAAQENALSQIHVVQEHFARLVEQVKEGSQTIASLEYAAGQSVQVINELMSSVIDNSMVEAEAGTFQGDSRRGNTNLEIRSLTVGPGSSVSIVESKSGPNALALFGSASEEEGENKQEKRYFRNYVRSTQGRAYGSSFTPHDFRPNPEQLVILLDGKREHTVDIAVNLPNVRTAVALLHAQPWIQRDDDDENLGAATAASTALAQKLTEEDPVEDDDPADFNAVRCGCLHYNRLPRPLQTTTTIRCSRRFDTAIATLVQVLHSRFEDGAGGFYTSAMAMAAMRLDASVRHTEEVEGALEISNTGNYDLDFGQAEILGDDDDDATVVEAVGGIGQFDDLDGF